MKIWKKVGSLAGISLLVIVGSTAAVAALQSSSQHYGVDETFFGSGGELNACSTDYCSKQAAGETAVGNAASADYQIQAGNNTDREDSLTLIVNTTAVDVGTLTASTTKTATATFSVLSYLASGYAVYTSSPGPKNGGYTMHNLSSATASSTGTEQFGINLVANSCPANSPITGLGHCTGSLGSNPVEVPDTTFSFGHAASGYDTVGSYQYNNGDEIAYSDSSSGETDYTISYLFNISPVTPGGTYTMQQSIVATSTF